MRKVIAILLFSIISTGVLSAQNLESVIVPKGLSQIKIVHSNYTTSFNASYKVPNYVSWSISSDELGGAVSRNGYSFTEDPDLKGAAVSPMDYSRSGYDRGHMCPAADNKLNDDYMRESFYMTNICPQNHTLNEKTWANLENACRSWARSSTVYVVSGPYFDGKPKTFLGNNKVAVPDGFWKVILRQVKGQWRAIGFKMPNQDVDDVYDHYVVSVDEVEKLTGYDFFSALEDKIEKEIESSNDLSFWSYNGKH